MQIIGLILLSAPSRAAAIEMLLQPCPQLLHPERVILKTVSKSIFGRGLFAQPLKSRLTDASHQLPETSPSALSVSTMYHHRLLIGWPTSAGLSECAEWLGLVMIGARSRDDKGVIAALLQPHATEQRTYICP